MNIAIIPGRAGSKRIPDKNIRTFAGSAMISWPIKAALESGLFDRVIVSTDSETIADISRAAGAEVPFLRPANLADDHTGLRLVLRHAISSVEENNKPVDFACCLYATAAFVVPSDLKSGYDMMREGSMYAFAAASYPHPIQRAFHLNENGGVVMNDPNSRIVRTQDLAENYHEAGMFFWGTRESFYTEVPIFSEQAQIVQIPRARVHDIDEPEDWDLAELSFQVLRQRGDL